MRSITLRLTMRRAGLAALALLGTAARAGAHEFWLSPDAGEAGEGAVRLFVGEPFAGEELPRDPGRILEFRQLWLEGGAVVEAAVEGDPGVAPAGWFRRAAPGAQLLAYRGAPSRLELPAEAFNAYLLEEGLYAPLARRREAGLLGRAARERYARYAKALFDAGGAGCDPALVSRPLGHRLEIVPLAGYEESGPRALLVEVLFEGRPLEGAVVFAWPEATSGEPSRAARLRSLTDGGGRARFELDRGGAWLLSLVHAVPSEVPEEDWDTSWATLLLGLPGAAAPSVSTRFQDPRKEFVR